MPAKKVRKLQNRDLRRKDPTIRQIKDGKVTKRYEVTRESLMQELKQDLEADKPLTASPADPSAVVEAILPAVTAVEEPKTE